MVDGMSLGIPLIKFILIKVPFSALNDYCLFLKNYSLALHEHFVKTVDYQKTFGRGLSLCYEFLKSRDLYFSYQYCLLRVPF